MDKQMLMHPRMHIRTHLHTYVHARTHTHAHTHTRTRTYTLSLLKHFGPYARVACCPSTIRDPPPPHTPTHTQQPHTHTHTEYSLIHLLVHMQKWLVAHVQGARTYTQMHTHTHTTDTHDTFVHTFWSTCRSGLLPMFKAHTHTHTHTRCSRTHLLVHMQEWLVAHVQGAHTYTQIYKHTQDALVHTFWSTCRSGLLPMYKTHTHTHKILSYAPFGLHAGVACCPCTRHTHTHTQDALVHTFWSTCRSGLLPIYKAPMSCRAGISKGKLHGRASRQMFIISFL